MKKANLLSIVSMLLMVAACGGEQNEGNTQGYYFSSDKATLLDFEFDGEFVTTRSWAIEGDIQNQLMYTIGQLNDNGGVGRLDAVKLTDIQSASEENGKRRVTYHAVLPVAWPSKYDFYLPKSYTFKLPYDMSYSGLSSFVQNYGTTCIDLWSAHNVTVGSMWYYYRPEARNCKIAADDILQAPVTISKSTDNSDGKYPEIDMIWKDNVLNAIVIFGKDNAGATGFTDFGVAQYGQFNYRLRWTSFAGLKLDPTPSNIPSAPDATFPEINWEGTFEDGRVLKVHAFLIDNPRMPSESFKKRYAELSGDADIVIYNGHAALGDNVRAFTRMGKPNPGQYTIVSMMGCDTFAYVDGYMAQQRAEINPDDPQGTKYLDMITNIVPTNPTMLPTASFALIQGVVDPKNPQTFYQILRNFEYKHYSVVTGDEDNTYTPEN